jgi:AAHS family 4-hydroxybenzoate transporter-like MFS transporter
MAMTIDAASFVDRAAFRGLVRRVPFLCGLLMIVEGIDTYGIGYVGPFISKALAVGPEMLGLIYTGTMIGSLLGAIMIAPLADRIGCRKVLIGASLTLGVCTTLTPLAGTAWHLFILRFIIGVGFGATVPTAFSMAADYAPQRIRARCITIMASGIAAGVILAGLASAYVIPAFGWQALLYLCGAVSLATGLLFFVALPESISFALRAGHRDRDVLVPRLLAEQGIAAGTIDIVAADRLRKSPGLDLLRGGRGKLTLVLWFLMAATYSVEFFLSSWLPTLLMASGASVKTAGLVTAAAKVGSVIGDVSIGILIDRMGAWRIIAATFACAVLAVLLLGASSGIVLLAVPLIIISCFFIDGGFGGVMALMATSYPGSMRASANGWISGMARLLGGGLGTMTGGTMVATHWSVGQSALLISVPLAAVAIVVTISGSQRLFTEAMAKAPI